MINCHIVIHHYMSVTVPVTFGKIIPDVLLDAPDECRVVCLHCVMFAQFLKDGQYLATGWTFFAEDSKCGCVMHPHQQHKLLCFPQVLIAHSGQSAT